MKFDCFGCKDGNCTILSENVCEKSTCHFYATRESAVASRIRSVELLRKKGLERTVAIDSDGVPYVTAKKVK